MIEAAIIDDEIKNISILKKLLAEFCPEVKVVAEGGDLRLAVKLIKEHKPSLVFLDIEMPYGNAFDLLDKLMPVSFEVIFVTAFNNYALKAFKYSALDYLLKPINIKELITAVNKASVNINLKASNDRLKNLLDNIQMQKESQQKIALTSKDQLVFITVQEIIRCEANGIYTFFFLKQNQKFISSKNIGEYEEILPDTMFFRVHHSHIINLNEIKKYHRGRGGYVEMSDGSLIDVAVRRKEDFLSRIGEI